MAGQDAIVSADFGDLMRAPLWGFPTGRNWPKRTPGADLG